MDGENEQRVAIKFCFKASLSATDTLVLVQTAYRNDALNRSNVFRWYLLFRDAKMLVADNQRCGRRKKTRTKVNVAVVAADLVKNYRRIASRMITESLNIPKTSSSYSEKGFLLSRFFCYRIMRPPTKLQVFDSFEPKTMLQIFITPVISRFVSARLFSAPQVVNEGLHFANVAEIQEAVIDELKNVQKEKFSAGFQKMYDSAKTCFYANGAYFK
jgi:hypothetical protein